MKFLALFGILILSNLSCYTFKDISIKPDVKTFSVEDFNISANAPGSIDQTFTEELKRKILSETRLYVNDNEPNIIFNGTIISYSVVSTATDSQNTASLNKLEIRIKVKYSNILHDEEDWDSTFSDYATFERDVNLSDVQDDLIEEIFEQIIDSIINKAFSNW